MKSPFTALPLAALLFPAAVFAAGPAAGPFDGTWRTKLDSMKFEQKPDVYEIREGVFKCGTCVPPYSVIADGIDHKVSGHSYYDTVAVREMDARTVTMTNKLGGKVIFEDTMMVSLDGKTLSDALKDHTGAKVATWTQLSSRVSAGPAGSHAVSGSWKIEHVPDASAAGTTVTYHMTADGLQSNYNGQTYDARFDGQPVPVANDPGRTMVALKRVTPNVIEETDTRDGKVTDVTLMTVAADGKSIAVINNDHLHGATTTFTMVRQH